MVMRFAVTEDNRCTTFSRHGLDLATICIRAGEPTMETRRPITSEELAAVAGFMHPSAQRQPPRPKRRATR